MYKVYLKYISGISWEYLRHIYGISQTYFRHISGIYQPIILYISDISQAISRVFLRHISIIYWPYLRNIIEMFQPYLVFLSCSPTWTVNTSTSAVQPFHTNKHKMKINFNKTRILPFDFSQKYVFLPQIQFPECKPLEVIYHTKLLGVTISSDLSCSLHTTDITKRTTKKLWVLVCFKSLGGTLG